MARYTKYKESGKVKALRKAKRIFINGEWWKLERKKDLCLDGQYLWGLCDPEKKTIQVDGELEGIELANTLIHEMLHGIFPILNEATVTFAADDIVEVLNDCKLLKC